MTRSEAGQICKEVRHCLWILDEQKPIWDKGTISEALDMAIEALQQEPKRGYWLDAREEDPCWYICSECKRMVDDDSNYCPNCGARMESDTE